MSDAPAPDVLAVAAAPVLLVFGLMSSPPDILVIGMFFLLAFLYSRPIMAAIRHHMHPGS